MSTSKKKTTNTRQVSLAAESTDSDLSPHEDQIQSLMNVFNFSRAKAEEEVGRLNQTAQSPSAVDESQEIIKLYTGLKTRLTTEKISLTLGSTILQVPVISALVYAHPKEQDDKREVCLSYRVKSSTVDPVPVVEVVPPSEADNDSDVETVELNALQVEAIMFGVLETEGLTHCPPGYRRVDSWKKPCALCAAASRHLVSLSKWTAVSQN